MLNKKIKDDPYRWLESDSIKTRSWINKQEKIAKAYFAGNKNIDKFNKIFSKSYRVDTSYLPIARGNTYFFRFQKASEEQPSIYIKQGISGKPKKLIDINKVSKLYGSIQDWSVSKNGKLIGIQFSKASNDKCSLYFFDVEKKKFLVDYIPADNYPYLNLFDTDNIGFWYERSDSQGIKSDEKYNKKIYYHKFGDYVKNDVQIFGCKLSKTDRPFISRSDDEKYFIIHVDQKDSNSRIYFGDRNSNPEKYINITNDIKGKSTARISGEYIYIKTDSKAPNSKILRIRIPRIKTNKWETFIKETNFNIEKWSLKKNMVLVEYLYNVSSRLYAVNLKTKKQCEIKLPGFGSISALFGEFSSKEMFFSFSSFNFPTTQYRLNLTNLKYKKYWQAEIYRNFKSSKIVVKQEWSKSKDGTKIPMFIVHKKGLKLNNDNPTLVYAYGGFNNSITPSFSAINIKMIEDGGIYVLANIRGGNEFGDDWNKSAILKNRHKCFEDFASVLIHLSKNKYTNPKKIAIYGGSNGGLLMSVIMLRYPNLFKTALISVPVTDMLRFHLFDGGKWWISEYGDPDNPSMRKYLESYSPYHNVENINYPSALFMTSDHDDRVRPMHSYKMVARLNANKNQKNPIILDIQKNSGHSGSGKITPFIEKMSRMFAFIYKELDI